ncbi:hypothetical protein CEXT_573421 [Caerostris extrusa]|uniref:Uncharacterized protein n=1 Tax=Caerostris extrusa TaxID=172846 RepID=A0AAV4XSL3_CAEEX|nr:hypothetical protein CEXT_573421 [Caerostris extrusa]
MLPPFCSYLPVRLQERNNSVLRRNLAANPKGNKACLGTKLREDMAAREPIRAKKQLHQKTGRSDISNYFPGTSTADPVYQIVVPEQGTTVLFLMFSAILLLPLGKTTKKKRKESELQEQKHSFT